MKNVIYCLLSILILISCDRGKIENDSENPCYQDCTGFVYRFVTTDSIGIPGIGLSLYSTSGGGAGWFGGDAPVDIRIIGQAVTNTDGYAYMNVSLSDVEISGHIKFALNVDALPKDKFFVSATDYVLPKIEKRDTIMNQTFYFPLVNYITVHLNNFEPINQNDSFRVSNDLNIAEYVKATTRDNIVKLKVAPNEINTIRIGRTKNGKAIQPEVVKIFVPWNNDIVLSFDY